MARIPKYIFIIVLLLPLLSCNKEKLFEEILIGTWVSENNIDTLHFIDKQLFEKSFILPSRRSHDQPFLMLFNDGIKHSFEYSISATTITIQYSGPFFIAVEPSTHQYYLDKNKLTIDFSNRCYGFESKVENYYKQ